MRWPGPAKAGQAKAAMCDAVQVVKALDPAGSRLQKVWGHTLYHLDDLQVERRCQVRALAPTPGPGSLPLPDAAAPVAFPGNSCHSSSRGGVGAQASGAGSVGQLLAWEADWASLPWPDVFKPKAPPAKDRRAVLDYRGGETVALARLKYYLWESDLLATYFDTRNGMLGGDYSTKFSAWLAAGCLSPRQIYHEIKRYEQQRTANKSTYWVVFELLWRDFFRFYAIKHGSRIFFETGPIASTSHSCSPPSQPSLGHLLLVVYAASLGMAPEPGVAYTSVWAGLRCGVG
ncbi:photolyase/cryptochrome alpha/beta domain-containing protein [Haematococcus lacustris]|uniref:Photolyase/cryptochrome alpha/beta domain-containing protein n=1 Tax=Haematococcus lacustris TaxID=44745 RepID=A0A699ZMY8_HAELA|nr:photolyase/cryptochrome alpha/beta domain-containing protein [Haematococcus lacustris]